MTHQNSAETGSKSTKPKVWSQNALKLLAFELSRGLKLEFYFEAGLLLEAYQIMHRYQIPLADLHAFGQETSNKLTQFSTAYTNFCERYGIAVLPNKEKVSMGVSLKTTPFGIFLLNVMQIKLSSNLEHISAVFTSPFLAHDLAARHEFDASVRKRVHAHIELKTYGRTLENFEAWQDFVAMRLPESTTLLEWLRLTEEFLYILEVSVPSSFLPELRACLLSVSPYFSQISYAEFLLHLQAILEGIPVADETALAYALYLQDQTEFIQEPLPLKVNPFLPLALLQKYQALDTLEFKDADPLVQLQIMNDLVRQADAQFFPSVRVEDVALCKKDYRLAPGGEILQQPERLAHKAQIGGTALLNEQSTCAFKAFAHFQLRVNSMDQEEAWLNAKLKGIAIHRILEQIWTKLKSQEQLLGLGQEDLCTLVTETTNRVILSMHQQTQFFLPSSLAALEIKRIIPLILLWLAEEKTRPPFQVVALEQERLVYLGPLVIKLRLDRIDKLAEGSLVIDYKTGLVKQNAWSKDQMTELQLPLYLQSTGAEGAAFAEVSLNPKFSGMIADALPRFSELKYAEALSGKSWEDVLTFWQQAIENLAQDIIQGKASVAPEPGACEYCDLQPICRIKEKEQA